MGNDNLGYMELRDAVAQIARYANVPTAGLSKEGMRIFVNTVAELSKLTEREKADYLVPLRDYFNSRKDAIMEFLKEEYGKQAMLMGNQVHSTIFGEPWKD